MIESVIRAGGPRIVLQPVVAIEDGALCGMEALSRFASGIHAGPDAWFREAGRWGWG